MDAFKSAAFPSKRGIHFKSPHKLGASKAPRVTGEAPAEAKLQYDALYSTRFDFKYYNQKRLRRQDALRSQDHSFGRGICFNDFMNSNNCIF